MKVANQIEEKEDGRLANVCENKMNDETSKRKDEWKGETVRENVWVCKCCLY